MTQLTKLAAVLNGLVANQDLTTYEVVVSSLRTGSTSGNLLTDTILGNLINLQNGTDFSNGTNSHTHDGRYYTQAQLNAHAGATTSGAFDIGVFHTATNYTAAGATVEQHIAGIDTALGTVSAVTSLTGDVTGSGPGATATTVAKIQGTTVSGTTGTGNVMFSASPTTTGTLTAAAVAASGNISSSGGTVSGTNLTTGGHASADLALTGGTMSGAIAMGSNKITGLASGTASGDALQYGQIGVANGIAGLDSGGKVPYAQLPSALMTFKGAWNASTNSPSLADGTGTTGDVYRASVAGTQNLGSGSQTWAIGDFAIYNGTIWQHSPAADGVSSVNGSTGAVTVNAINQLTGDVTTSAASQSQSEASTVAKIQGTTVSGTTGTGNVVFSAGPTLTGTLTAATITASGAVTGSNLSGTNTGDQTITLTGDVTGSGTGSFAATIAAGSVTAAKLATVTDGTTLDQSGAGSTLEIKAAGVNTTQLANNAVTSAKIATAAFDGTTISGGGGSAATVLAAPSMQQSFVSGVALTANTSYLVRMAVNGETAGRIYLADDASAATNLKFWAIGMASGGGSGVSIGGTVTVTLFGTWTLGSSDSTFAGGDIGKAVWLTTSGAWSTTAPSSAGTAAYKVGVVQTTSSMLLDSKFLTGIN